MATIARERVVESEPGPARRGLWGIAGIVSFITSVVLGFLLIGILLVVLEANRGNEIVNFVLNIGEFFADPFDNIFSPDGYKAKVALNWGIAALIYGLIGGLIVNHLRR
jgi:vacuolar-type H+-ATPase subunit I/STV1